MRCNCNLHLAGECERLGYGIMGALAQSCRSRTRRWRGCPRDISHPPSRVPRADYGRCCQIEALGADCRPTESVHSVV